MAIPQITSTEAVLLGLLQRNARTTNKDLARAAGIAESTCIERVRSLQQRGVIRGYHADVDLAALGLPIRAHISVRLHPKTTAAVNEFRNAVLDVEEVLSVSTLAGNDDFIVEVAVADVEHLRSFLLDHITSQPNVADTNTALIFDHHQRFHVEPVLGELR